MEHYVAYHSVDLMGREYTVSGNVFSHASRKPESFLQKVIGNLVWVVVGKREGKETRYRLAGVYVPRRIASQQPDWLVEGPGVRAPRDTDLTDFPWFSELFAEQSRFSFGLNRIRSGAAIESLQELVPEFATIAPADGKVDTLRGRGRSALYLNGIFQGVLDEIVAAQESDDSQECYLQPYSSQHIRLLANSDVSAYNPIRVYISTTELLPMISYRALVAKWEDKSTLQPKRLKHLNEQVARFQPGEKEIYLDVDGKPCVNLLTILKMERLAHPVPVSVLVKISNNEPLQVRTRSGGWSPVFECAEWIGTTPLIGTQEDFEIAFRASVGESLSSTLDERQKRLAQAASIPERVQVLSLAFRRNPDVVAEVLFRAQGKCERCNHEAPFLRGSDGSPYLEVHHRKPLAEHGQDTVENAIALCPNCHRELHFGMRTYMV